MEGIEPEDQTEEIGNLLIEEGLITQEELEEAAREVSLKTAGLNSWVSRIEGVRRAELAAFVGTDYEFVVVPNPERLKISSEVLRSIPPETAKNYTVLPAAMARGILFVLCANPDIETARMIRKAAGTRIKLLKAPGPALEKIIRERYEGRTPAKPAEKGPPERAVAVSGEDRIRADMYVRLLTEWEQTYTEGRPVRAIKVA